MPAREAHPATTAEKAELAQFVITNSGTEGRAEIRAQFVEAFARAFQGGVVAQAEERGVGGIIAVGDDVIGFESGGLFEKAFEEVILAQRMAQPIIPAVQLD